MDHLNDLGQATKKSGSSILLLSELSDQKSFTLPPLYDNTFAFFQKRKATEITEID